MKKYFVLYLSLFLWISVPCFLSASPTLASRDKKQIVDSLRQDLSIHPTTRDSLNNYYLMLSNTSRKDRLVLFDTIQDLAYRLQDPYCLAYNMINQVNIVQSKAKVKQLADLNRPILKGTPYEGISQYICSSVFLHDVMHKGIDSFDSISSSLNLINDSLLQTQLIEDRIEAELNIAQMAMFVASHQSNADYSDFAKAIEMYETVHSQLDKLTLVAHTYFEFTISQVLLQVYAQTDKNKLLDLANEQWALYDKYYSQDEADYNLDKYADKSSLYTYLYSMMMSQINVIGEQEAENYYRKLDYRLKSIDNLDGAYFYSYQYYHSKGDYKTAYTYLDSLQECYLLKKDYSHMADNYKRKAECNEHMDSLELALEDYKNVLKYQKKVDIERHSRLLAEVNNKLEMSTLVVKQQVAHSKVVIYRALVFAISIVLVMVIVLILMMIRYNRIKNKETRQRLIAQERYKTMITMSPDAILLVNKKGNVLEESDHTSHFYKSKGIGTNFFSYFPDYEQEKLKTQFYTLFETNEMGTISIGLDGVEKRLSVELTGQVFKMHDYQGEVVIINMRDVTERQTLMQNLMKNDRMVGLGRLVTSMAHEINQPLVAMSFTLENISDSFSREDENYEKMKKKMHRIFDDIARIERVLDHVRLYARGENDLLHSLKPFSLNLSVNNSVDMLGEYIRSKGFKLEVQYQEGLPRVLGNSYRFEQVVINLLTNAQDAIESRSKERQGEVKQITVSTSMDEKNVYMTMKDNGCGLDEKEIPMLFHAFYSTKEESAGTGLGLAIVKDILKEMGATITVDSKVNEGTTFTVIFAKEICC